MNLSRSSGRQLINISNEVTMRKRNLKEWRKYNYFNSYSGCLALHYWPVVACKFIADCLRVDELDITVLSKHLWRKDVEHLADEAMWWLLIYHHDWHTGECTGMHKCQGDWSYTELDIRWGIGDKIKLSAPRVCNTKLTHSGSRIWSVGRASEKKTTSYTPHQSIVSNI